MAGDTFKREFWRVAYTENSLALRADLTNLVTFHLASFESVNG